MAVGGAGFGFFQLGENPSAVFEIALARFGQIHTARGADQQLRADALLQCRHCPGHTGRRQIQTSRRRREPLLLGHGKEHLHFLESVHSAPGTHGKEKSRIGGPFQRIENPAGLPGEFIQERQQRLVHAGWILDAGNMPGLEDAYVRATDDLGHFPRFARWPWFVLLAAQHQRGFGRQRRQRREAVITATMLSSSCSRE